MALFDAPDDFEGLEVPPHHWMPTEPKLPLGNWKGPLFVGAIDRCLRHHDLHIGGFGVTSSHLKSVKKYTFLKEYCDKDGKFVMWRYQHCKGNHNILIRRVRPPIEVQLEVTEHLEVTNVTADRIDFTEAAKATAVAENGRTVLELIVTRDIRLQKFKAAIKEKCVEMDLCTRQSTINVFRENVLVTSNNILRSDLDANKKTRPMSVIAAPDGDLGTPPQSRVAKDGRMLMNWECPSSWTGRMLKILEGDDPTESDYISGDEASPEPSAKKQKTAVADADNEPGGEQNNGVTLPVRPSMCCSAPHSRSTYPNPYIRNFTGTTPLRPLPSQAPEHRSRGAWKAAETGS